jgi:ferredoxin
VKDSYCDGLGACLGHCPQGALEVVEREAENYDEEAVKLHLKENRKKDQKTTKGKTQWPIQLNLVSTTADFFADSDILLAADCVAATHPDFHSKLILEKTILIGCPKFDDATKYATKLGEILKNNNIKSITVAHMEVPCCSGLKWIAQKAVESSNKSIPIKNIMIGVNGEIK